LGKIGELGGDGKIITAESLEENRILKNQNKDSGLSDDAFEVMI